MYKNKVFRAILSWAWLCPYFRERGLGWPCRLNPKAIPAPRFSHLPAIAHSFLLAYSYGRNCEQNYAEAFVLFCFCSFQQTKLPANPLTAFSQITNAQPPAPHTRWATAPTDHSGPGFSPHSCHPLPKTSYVNREGKWGDLGMNGTGTSHRKSSDV